MRRPKLLDLFCKQGGAAKGYDLAGFDVTGVDIEPQPRYPFRFIQADALDFPLWGFDAIHASPPCQAYSRATAWRGDRGSHQDLIGPTRELLKASGVPWVIENVQEARHLLVNPIRLCGTAFGLQLQSHRFFEMPWAGLSLQPPCQHDPADYSRDHGAKQTEATFRDAMGCEWMTIYGAREAIPPAFTEWIGRQLIAHLSAVAA